MANTTGIEEINVGGTPYEVVDAAARKMISDEYNSAVTYAKGNLCIYSGKVYEAIKETTGTWDATAWEETTLAKVNAGMKKSITDLTDNMKNIKPLTMGGILTDFHISNRGKGEWKFYYFNSNTANSPASYASGIAIMYTALESAEYGGIYAFANGGIFASKLNASNWSEWIQII